MSEPEPSVPGRPTSRTLGRMLAETRKARGWTIRYAASQLRLSESTLAHLEAEEFAMLPSAVYVKGYLRNYARLLRLPPDDIVQAYVEASPGQAQGAIRGLEMPVPLDAGGQRIRSTRTQTVTAEQAREHNGAVSTGTRTLIGAATVIAAAYGLAWWWPERGISLDQLDDRVAKLLGTAEKPDGSNRVAAPEPDDQRLSPVALPPAPPAVEQQSALSPDATTNEARNQLENPTAPDSSAPATSRQPDQDTLILSFRGDSWATVFDADGNRLMNQVGGKGTTRTLRGKAPFKLTIGRVSDVTITMNGESYALPNAEKRATEKFSVPFADPR